MITSHTAFPIVPDSMGKCEKTFLYTLYGCIQQNGHKPGFGVQQLAGSVRLSRVQLNRKLSQLLGCSALNLIMGYRFYIAKQLLCESDMPIKVIAAQCGFRRHGAFCRSFATEFRCSPSHYRNTYQADYSSKPLNWKIPLYEEDMLLLQKLAFEKTWLCDLLSIVLSHISDKLFSMEQLAPAVGVSISTLNRKTKELFKVTPQRFIRDIRLQYACELLSIGKVTIAEIAYEAGFFDPAHFCRCFKATLGCCPSDYKPFITAGSISQLKETLMNQNGK